MLMQDIPYKYKTRGACYHFSISPDKMQIATAGGSVCIWNYKTGEKETVIPIKNVNALCYAPCGTYLAIQNTDGVITVLGASDYSTICKIGLKSEGVADGLFFVDSTHLLAAVWDGRIFEIDIFTKNIIKVGQFSKIGSIQKINENEYAVQHSKDLTDNMTTLFYPRSGEFKEIPTNCVLQEYLSEAEAKTFIRSGLSETEQITLLNKLKTYNKYHLQCENRCIESGLCAVGVLYEKQVLQDSIKKGYYIADKEGKLIKNLISEEQGLSYRAYYPGDSSWSIDGKYLALIYEKEDREKTLTDVGIRIFETEQWRIVCEISEMPAHIVRFTDDGETLLIGTGRNLYCVDLSKIISVE